MCKNVIILILIALVVANVQNGTRVEAMAQTQLTAKQADLFYGYYKQHDWRNSWFTTIHDGQDWMHVDYLVNQRSRPGTWKKLRLIPRLMGCNYGVKFYWFLVLAIQVIEECNRLSVNGDDNTGDCWNKLAVVLQDGSYTMLEVMRSLAYTHSTTGDDPNLDEFYQYLSTNQHFLCTVVLPDDHSYVSQFQSLIDYLLAYLASNCQPECPRLDMEVLVDECQRRFPRVSYDYYVHIMKYYMEDVSNHLIEIGFRYDMSTGQTTYVYTW